MKGFSKFALGVAALAGVLALGTSARADITSFSDPGKCLSAKIKDVGKDGAGLNGCYAKGGDPACLSKNDGKLVSAFNKLDLKPPCPTTGDGTTRANAADTDASGQNTLVGTANAKCDGAKIKCVGKYMAAKMGCFSKAAAKAPGAVDSTCVSKAATSLTSCINKAESKPPCTNTGQAAALTSAANTDIHDATCALDPSNADCASPCGNNANDPGEPCDPTTAFNTWAQCGSDFTCTASCNCACPTSVVFAGDATSTNSILDTGWTGISHRAPIISDGQVTVGLSCSATSRPCGTCNVTQLLPNPHADAGQLNDRRCSQDSSRKCTVNSDCTTQKCLGGTNNGATCANDTACPGGTCPAVGFCNFYFGAPLSLAAGGVSTCISNQFNGNVTGTAEVETGDANTTAFLTSKVFNGIAIDNPCPRCSDTVINDGVAGGTCDGGPRIGLACDSNGQVPARPDFGKTSLDCPANPAGIIATLSINLSNSTGTITKTLSASSPNCNGSAGDKCLCSTCNTAAAEPCFTSADCPATKTCGGKRCLGGANVGAACANNTECPSSSCAVPGALSKPSGCQDDTTTVNTVLECSDTYSGDPADQEGLCTIGPNDQNCTLASGHAQRGCTADSDCGGGGGSCGSQHRRCFLTGGGNFNVGFHNTGTNTLIGVGMADVPMADTAHPTLAAVFCVGPTGASAINDVAGLPGPSRISITGTAVAHP